MAASSFRLDTRKAEKLINRIITNMARPGSTLDKIGMIGQRDVINHFKDERGPFGAWPSLQSDRKRGGSKILQDTGTLRVRNRYRVEGKNVVLYNDTVYAGVHNYGSPKKNIPQRKFLWISGKGMRDMVRQLIKDIIGGF